MRPCVGLTLVVGILLCSANASGAILHRRRSSPATHASALSYRKRLHVNDLIAEPGTLEIDSGGLYSYTTGEATVPAILKYTPDGDSLLIGRTEYSLAFDSVDSVIDSGLRSVQFGDRLTFAATSVVYDSEHLDVAIAAQGTKLLRDDAGARLGAIVIARYDRGGNSVGVSIGWTGATSSSTTNPAGIWDLGFGYGRPLSGRGFLSRVAPHLNLTVERATGFETTLSGFLGIEYQMTRRFAVDLSVQRYNLAAGVRDRQVLLGTTWNLGRIH